MVKTGPADTLQALGELLRRLAPELRGDLMTCGEILRRERGPRVVKSAADAAPS